MARNVKRPSSLQSERTADTQRRILAAAADVFEERGFAAARIEDIAASAGVAVPTVYKTFTNKPTLLVGALRQAQTAGEEGGVDEQAWFTEQLDEPDPVRQLRLIARNARRIYERAGALLAVLRAAAPVDAVLAQAWHDIEQERLARGRKTAASLVRKAKSRVRTNKEELAVTLWALTEPQLFTTYVSSGRSADAYERWLADVLQRAVLGNG